MKKVMVLVMLAFAFGGATVAAEAQTGPTLSQRVDDAAITAEVKARLVAERPANLMSINVDTQQGIVRLQGSVPTLDDRFVAERIARQAHGVVSVDNDLMIEQGAARDPSAAASPATGDLARHTVIGEVTDIDVAKGRLELKTSQGDMELVLPPGAVRTLRKGDRVAVDLAVRPWR